MKASRFVVLSTAPLLVWAAAIPSAAGAETDACKLLTAEQVSAAVGAPVAPGEHVTPTFVKTCTWNVAAKSAVRVVTLNLQTGASYDGSKRMAHEMAAMGKGGSVKPVGVGNDGYYFVAGDMVVLMVKKDNVAFKVAVYAKLPPDKTEVMELILANEVVSKL